MKKILVTNYDKQLINALNDYGYEVISVSAVSQFNSFLKYHTDIFYCKIEDTLFVSHLADSSFLRCKKIKTVKVKTVKEGYPFEAGINCCYIAHNLICNTNVVSNEILEFAKQNNINIIHTNQGYAKCSIAVVGENAVITEDDGIEKALSESYIQVLKIPKGTVSLEGFEYGFIGGASFYDSDKKTVFFFGDINLNPYANKIIAFCERNGSRVVSLLQDVTLTDYGSAVLL